MQRVVITKKIKQNCCKTDKHVGKSTIKPDLFKRY